MKINSFVFLPKIKWSVICLVFLLISCGVAEFENNTNVINKSGHFTVFAIKSRNYDSLRDPRDIGTNKYYPKFFLYPNGDTNEIFNPHNLDTIEEVYLIKYDKNVNNINKNSLKDSVNIFSLNNFEMKGDTFRYKDENELSKIKDFSIDEALKMNPYKKFIIHKNQLHLDPNFEYNIEINEQSNLEFKKAGTRREDYKIFTPFHIIYFLLKEIFSSES